MKNVVSWEKNIESCIKEGRQKYIEFEPSKKKVYYAKNSDSEDSDEGIVHFSK